VDFLTAEKLAPGDLGLLQQYRPKADIQYLAYSGAVTPAASRLIASSLPAGGVTAQLWLNIDGYLRGRPICRRPRNHLRS